MLLSPEGAIRSGQREWAEHSQRSLVISVPARRLDARLRTHTCALHHRTAWIILQNPQLKAIRSRGCRTVLNKFMEDKLM